MIIFNVYNELEYEICRFSDINTNCLRTNVCILEIKMENITEAGGRGVDEERVRLSKILRILFF